MNDDYSNQIRDQIMRAFSISENYLAGTNNNSLATAQSSVPIAIEAIAETMKKITETIEIMHRNQFIPAAGTTKSKFDLIVEAIWKYDHFLAKINSSSIPPAITCRALRIQRFDPNAEFVGSTTINRHWSIRLEIGYGCETKIYLPEQDDADCFLKSCEILLGKRPSDDVLSGDVFDIRAAPVIMVFSNEHCEKNQRFIRRASPREVAEFKVFEAKSRTKNS